MGLKYHLQLKQKKKSVEETSYGKGGQEQYPKQG